MQVFTIPNNIIYNFCHRNLIILFSDIQKSCFLCTFGKNIKNKKRTNHAIYR